MGPLFEVSSERLEKWEIDLALPGLVVQHDIHYTTATPMKRDDKGFDGNFRPAYIFGHYAPKGHKIIYFFKK